MKRRIKNYLKRMLRKRFEMFQRLGVNILPVHFYSQIPKISDYKADSGWKLPYSLHGINGIDVNEQLDFVKEHVSAQLVATFAALNIHQTAILENGEDSGFGFVESDFLYSYIQQTRPSKIIQVGCGVATAVMLRAGRDCGYQPEIVCVEPYPTLYIRGLAEKGQIKLITSKAQNVDVATMTDLGSGDLFFLDSTHTVKPGSEVNRIVLEIFPRLKKGVRLHIHDIFFPYDYTREFLTTELFFWSESVLIQAFLTQNANFRIMASFSMLHYSRHESLKKLFPLYDPKSNDEGLACEEGKHFPSSLYLEVIS